MAGREDKDKKPGLTYSSYLQIDKLLDCQHPNSDMHDEVLFILVHQAFELWFKQVLHDIHGIKDILFEKHWREIAYHTVINRLQRVTMVLKLVVEHFHILETMPPLNFVDFRDSLTGGSGFQSLQFRKIEKLLGIRDAKRRLYEGKDYKETLDPKDKDCLLTFATEGDDSTLFKVVDRWLAKTPGVDDESFWTEYKKNERFWDAEKKVCQLDSFLDDEQYKKQASEGRWQLSQRAMKGALLITMKQDTPLFQQPYQILSLLMDIDVALMKWRSTHIHMVHRMIGQKQGTGGTQSGSSGYDYLRSTYSDDYKVFLDLFKLATYLPPRSEIPPELTTEHVETADE